MRAQLPAVLSRGGPLAVPFALGALGVALLVGPACASKPRPVHLDPAPREFVAADYDAILKRWTRSEKLYTMQGVDDALASTSTFESWEFRWAYVIRYAEDYRLTIQQRKELLDAALDDAKQAHQFYVTLHGQRFQDADLLRTNPAWVARLVDDKGHVSAPEKIIAIRKPGLLERTYFPYTNGWRQTFRIRFPAKTDTGPTIADDAGFVVLRFSGPLGNLELTWERAH